MDFNTQFQMDYQAEINVDLFAGGGGASTGFEIGTNRPVDIAINHDSDAISMHTINHPHAKHYQSDIWEVDPVAVCEGRAVGHLHASPDCTHHSQARGGQPRKKNIRSLSWVVHRWAGKVRPRIITLENVRQILNWSPLIAKRCAQTGRVIKLDGTVATKGEITPLSEQFLIPDPKKKGKNWQHFVSGLKRLGYTVEWKNLCAADYGAPTTRERLFLIARCDGLPIVWPSPTHFKKPKRGQKKWRSAAECIDWSIVGTSIFERPKPLADATLKRIAKGIKRFVLDAKSPFIVPCKDIHSSNLVSLRKNSHGQHPQSPLSCITAGGQHHAVVTACMAQMNGGFNATPAKSPSQPMTTVTTTGSQQQLITAHLLRQFGNSVGQTCEDPMPTVVSGGGGKTAAVTCLLNQSDTAKALKVAAFLINYYGNGDARDLTQPADTLTTRDRLALVTVHIEGQPYVITDIKLRMLQPRELYTAQGFPKSYVIDRGHDGRKFTKTAQVRMVGNSVSPMPMMAIAKAQHSVESIFKQAI